MQTAKKHKQIQDKTLLSHVSLIRIYKRIAQKVDPHMTIKDIIKNITARGTEFAEHILNQT